MEVGRSIPGCRVVRTLDRLARTRGLPQTIAMDNDPEFTSRMLDRWACQANVELDAH